MSATGRNRQGTMACVCESQGTRVLVILSETVTGCCHSSCWQVLLGDLPTESRSALSHGHQSCRVGALRKQRAGVSQREGAFCLLQPSHPAQNGPGMTKGQPPGAGTRALSLTPRAWAPGPPSRCQRGPHSAQNCLERSHGSQDNSEALSDLPGSTLLPASDAIEHELKLSSLQGRLVVLLGYL